jgi:hypothetical protein
MKAFPRDVTVQTMKVRHIGVENELGVRCEMETIQAELNKRGLLQSVGHDGGGREFRTNPISVKSLNQVRGFKYVTEYYGMLAKNTTVLESGGTHIHISILNDDHENMEANATAMAITFYKQFQKIAGRQSMWARRLTDRIYDTPLNTTEQVRQYLAGRKLEDRVYSMKGSMLNPTRHQTLEFRGGKGSNDCTEILAWIEFLNNVVNACNRESVDGVQFKQLLKGKRISAYIKSLEGWRKLTKKELEQKFNGEAL